MPSQSELKHIAALKMPKFRQKYGQFIVEGRKNADEIIHSDYDIDLILMTETYQKRYNVPAVLPAEVVSDKTYAKLSQFETPPGILVLARTKRFELKSVSAAKLIVALDHVSDPGNLGTIIRTADWYGIHDIILSEGCTDFYNIKSLSATMGSFARCRFAVADLPEWLKDRNSYGCFLEGENIRQIQVDLPVVLVIGSESHGISAEVEKAIRHKVTIPGRGNAESLNAAIAAGIAMDNLIRLCGL